MNAQRNGGNDARRGDKGATDDDTSVVTPEPDTAEESAAPPGEPRRSRGVGRILFLLIAAGLAGLLYYYWGFWEQWGWFQAAKTEPAAPPPPAVTVANPITKELIEWKEFTGQFEAVDFVDVRARVSGYLESINFTDGQIVKKGDLLFVIEPKPYELALESAKAQLAQAEASSISPRPSCSEPPSCARRTMPPSRPMTSGWRR